MQFLFGSVVTAFVCLTGPTASGGPPDEPKAPKLRVGDPAPLLKVSKWLQGKEVKRYEPGKVYVVEFWATWCGPCIGAMPHLSNLQTEFKDRGLTVIGV